LRVLVDGRAVKPSVSGGRLKVKLKRLPRQGETVEVRAR
jgi:hypothetical protein